MWLALSLEQISWQPLICLWILLKEEFHAFTSTPFVHDFDHHILTEGLPIFSKARNLDWVDAEKLLVAKIEFSKIEKEGIISCSHSFWASPLHMVRKMKVGTPVAFTAVWIQQPYLTNIQAQASAISPAICSIFSPVGLKSGYHQVPMNPGDISKTAIITFFGLFEYFFMSFGFKNAGCSFPHLMHQCLGDLLFMFVYIDVTLVGLKSPKEHEDHLCQLITIPRENHLIIYPKKCMFGKSSVSFLGHTIIFPHFSAPQKCLCHDFLSSAFR